MYIPKDSHHPSSLMRGMVKGELVRFTRICNGEEERDKAWDRFSQAMQRRGHEKRMLERVKAGVPYTDRGVMLEGIWKPAADYLPGKLFSCLKSTDNLAATIKKGCKRRRGPGEDEVGEQI